MHVDGWWVSLAVSTMTSGAVDEGQCFLIDDTRRTQKPEILRVKWVCELLPLPTYHQPQGGGRVF